MNELIARLYDQAIVIKDGGDYVSGELDAMKFARLIAAECAKICYDEDFVSGSGYAQEITKRFGVDN